MTNNIGTGKTRLRREHTRESPVLLPWSDLRYSGAILRIRTIYPNRRHKGGHFGLIVQQGDFRSGSRVHQKWKLTGSFWRLWRGRGDLISRICTGMTPWTTNNDFGGRWTRHKGHLTMFTVHWLSRVTCCNDGYWQIELTTSVTNDRKKRPKTNRNV